jgi:hypothetical protein
MCAWLHMEKFLEENTWLAPRADVTPHAGCAGRGVRPIMLCSAGSLRGYEGLYPDTSKVAMQRL